MTLPVEKTYEEVLDTLAELGYKWVELSLFKYLVKESK